MKSWIRAAASLFFTTLALGAAQAQDSFYKGKTVELIIGYPPGGSNDVYARLLSTHLGKHIPGNPTVVARNMPGAGSFLAANHMASVAAKDGTSIAICAPTIALDEKLGTQGVRFKTAQLNWIGRISPLINMVMISKKSPVKTVADAQKTEVTLSGTGVGSTVSIYPTVMNNMFGTKYKLIMGYKGSNEAMLAVERGEVEGHSTAWEALKTAHPSWKPDGEVTIPVQFAIKPSKYADFFRAETAFLAGILNAESVVIDERYTPTGLTPSLVTDAATVFMVGAVDPAAEREKLTKQLADIEKQLAGTTAKLTNESFVSRAAPIAVEREREKQKMLYEQRAKLGALLQALG